MSVVSEVELTLACWGCGEPAWEPGKEVESIERTSSEIVLRLRRWVVIGMVIVVLLSPVVSWLGRADRAVGVLVLVSGGRLELRWGIGGVRGGGGGEGRCAREWWARGGCGGGGGGGRRLCVV